MDAAQENSLRQRGELALNSGAQFPLVPDPMIKVTVEDGAALHGEGVPASVSMFLSAQWRVPRASLVARAGGRNPVPRSLRHHYRVALGDVAVIEALAQLGPSWLVRTCDSPKGGGIEHLLIGPSGIFCMIVRHHLGGAIWIDGGVILADGERLPHLRDAEFSAVRLTQMMSDAIGTRAEATPCLVLTGSRSMTVAKPPRRVAVLTVRDIRAWLKGLSPVLSEGEVEGLRASAAAHPEFYVVGEAGSPSAKALDAFRKVRAEVAQARHVRLTWVTGALVLVWLMAVAGISGVTTSLLLH